MRWSAGLGVMLLAATAAADPVAPFEGRWQASEATATVGTLPAAAEDLVIELRRDGDGLRARWRMLEGGMEEVTFRPTERPGVLAPPVESPGLLGRFFPPDRADPLRGRRLVWVRLADDALVLYGMSVARDGDLTLDRRALRPDDGDLVLDLQRRDAAGEVLRVSARLERSGR
jgi:hypothetical protein